MAGVKALRKIQIGAESTAAVGTAVPATALFRFTGAIENLQETIFPEEDIGYLSGFNRAYVAKLGGQIQTEGEATFEQIPYVLEAGVKLIAPTTDTGSGYVYSYPFPTTAQNEIRTYTIEGGDDQAEQEVNYCFVKEFSIEGAPGEAYKLSATWVGQSVTTTDSFTTSSDVTVTAVEEMLFGKSKLYIDDSTGTLGATLKSNTLLGAAFKAKTGQQEVYAANGNKYFAFVKDTAPEITFDVTFEHDATATSEYTAWLNNTARQIRLLIEGSALTAAGAYTYKTCRIDMAGKWEKFDKLDELDGNDVYKGTFRARYDLDAALFCNLLVVNELATLP